LRLGQYPRKTGARIIGIHSTDLEGVLRASGIVRSPRRRSTNIALWNGLVTLEDLAPFWSRTLGPPDYRDPLFRTTDSSDRAGGQAEAVRLFGSRKLSDHQLSNGA
jgi:hypothetical protein